MTTDHDLFEQGSGLPTPKPAAAEDTAKAPAVPQRARRTAPARTERGDGSDYTAEHIEVLEGLEPVRRRPGMYIGGTDERALHHLFAEVIDNSMDEAVAGHASWIEVNLSADGWLSVADNGRGIPVDPHPKHKDKSALEVIMTTLHAGGKFDSKVYETSGGLHGVGASVVNALSASMVVQVAKTGFVFVLDRDTGAPVFPVDEVPVPQDGAPGEWLSPTQPMPQKPPALVPHSITPDDAWGLTFLDRGACADLFAKYRNDGLFTPPSEQGTLMFPFSGGGANWGGMAFNPASQLM